MGKPARPRRHLTMSADTRRFPAEWEPVEAVLMAWPGIYTDWQYVLPRAEQCFTAMAEAIAPHARVMVVAPDIDHVRRCLSRIPEERLVLVPCLINDTWTRDYGPITVFEGGRALPLDFCFNGWGLKFAAWRDNMVTSALDAMGIFVSSPENRRSLVLEGGSVDTDGQGLVLTTDSCILSPNRNGGMSRQQILEAIRESLGAQRVVSLAHGALKGDDTDGHIDTLARLVPPGDIIFYTGCADPYDANYRELKAMEAELRGLRTADGRPYHLVELPLPDSIYDEDGEQLPATYANFLYVNGAVVVPVYGQPLKDKMAADIIAATLPDYKVVTVDCSVLVEQHGSLHCSTMQIPAGTLAI